MALVELVEIESLRGTPREVAESGAEQYGQVLNTWKAIMNAPDMFAAYLPFVRQVAGPGRLDPLVKDLVALYVGYLNNCRYTVSHRATSARAKGASDDLMRSVTSGDWRDLGDDLRRALVLTHELTLAPARIPYSQLAQGVDAETLRMVRLSFDDREILELTMAIGLWNGLSRFHRVMDLDLDMPIAPEGVNPE